MFVTIIAHFNAFGTRTLFGDLLLSSAIKPPTEVHLPASRNINERIFLQPNFYIAGLSQKIVLINRRLALAWSGNYETAATLFESLKPLARLESVSSTYLETMFDSLDQGIKRDLSWISLTSSDSGSRLLTHSVGRLREYGKITEVTCAGSGRKQFQHIFPQLCRNVLPVGSGHSRDDGFTASVVSAFLGEEFDRPVHLQEGWGGGFEVVRLVGGYITRLRRQLSLNFFAEPQGAGADWRLWFVPNFRHTDYWNDHTIVQSVEHQVDAQGTIMPGRRDVFIVSYPGAPEPDISALPIPNLDRHDIVQVFVKLQGRPKAMTYAAAYTMPVLFYDAPPGLGVTRLYLDPMLIRDIIEGVQREIRRPVTYGGLRNRRD
jgi:hypothetical protein